ncbi:hypothetical protein CC79DRAFT_1331661 [Sarocladium strictum]
MSEMQHTLWLWLEGVFPRRLAYFFLIKNLTPSVADLLAGRTTMRNMKLIPSHREMPPAVWSSSDPSDPPPEGATNPCLRITDPATGKSRFLYESTSILLYLEELYPEYPMQPKGLIERAQMHDMLGLISLIGSDTNYKLRNTIPPHGMMMGLMPENQSQTAAENAEMQEKKGLLKLLEWAKEFGCFEKGWLTPGVDGPGLVDVALVPNFRFVELVWGIDILEDEDLKPFAEWYGRFKSLPFWKEYEEREDALPAMLAFGKTSRAAWIDSPQ